MGALDGIRVLDVGILVQAPQAASLMSDMGADVIKIEQPLLGDHARWVLMSPEDRRAPFYAGCNRGKRSITLDLRVPEGRDVMLKLVETADVMVSNFKAGTLDAWGLGYDDVAAVNPRIIYGVGTTFGPRGPAADRRGADIAAQAAGGLISTIGSDGDPPSPIGVTIADHIASQNLCNGVLAALYARERTGVGQRVEVSLLGGQIFAQASEYTAYFMTGVVPGRSDGGHPLIRGMYGVFPTEDGAIALPASGADRTTFFETIGRPDLADDQRFTANLYPDDVRNELFETLRSWFRTRSTDHWVKLLNEHGIPFAEVHDYAEVARDPQAWANGYLRKVQDETGTETTFVGTPIELSGTPSEVNPSVPELGQHTEEVLLDAGYTWDDIGKLAAAGAI